MKIDWSKAPDWAQWLAVDGDGEKFAFESKPSLNRTGTVWMPCTSTSEREFLSKGPRPEDCSKELYERPKKADLEIDWAEAPDWAQWLAVDAIGSAYWYRERPKPRADGIRQWDFSFDSYGNFAYAFDVEQPEDFTQALYERPATNEENTVKYNIELITAVRIKGEDGYEPVEISEGQWRSARDLMSLVDPGLGEGQWPKIKCIKLYRNMQPGMGLREAKAVVEAAWQERHSYHC